MPHLTSGRHSSRKWSRRRRFTDSGRSPRVVLFTRSSSGSSYSSDAFSSSATSAADVERRKKFCSQVGGQPTQVRVLNWLQMSAYLVGISLRIM